MKCHICNQEMRIVNSVTVAKNETLAWSEEIWRCDDCDRWWKKLWRWLNGR